MRCKVVVGTDVALAKLRMVLLCDFGISLTASDNSSLPHFGRRSLLPRSLLAVFEGGNVSEFIRHNGLHICYFFIDFSRQNRVMDGRMVNRKHS